MHLTAQNISHHLASKIMEGKYNHCNKKVDPFVGHYCISKMTKDNKLAYVDRHAMHIWICFDFFECVVEDYPQYKPSNIGHWGYYKKISIILQCNGPIFLNLAFIACYMMSSCFCNLHPYLTK